MNRNFKLTIAYDGTRYYGWEHQPNTDLTIQGKIESVLEKMTGNFQEVICAGRTDAGVHAKAMTASVILDTKQSEAAIWKYLNKYLPDDIVVTDVKEAADRFHPRYNATGKTYCYTLHVGKNKPLFDRKYVYHLDKCPDIKRMEDAASLLIGEHDFAAFCSNPRMKKSTVRIVDSIKVEKTGDYIYLTYHGSGFLQHMVRILTGTLVEVGLGLRTVQNVQDVLLSKDRKLAGETAPAQGLCLVSVDYS